MKRSNFLQGIAVLERNTSTGVYICYLHTISATAIYSYSKVVLMHAMKAYGAFQVQFHSFLTLVLYSVGWIGPKAILDNLEKI